MGYGYSLGIASTSLGDAGGAPSRTINGLDGGFAIVGTQATIFGSVSVGIIDSQKWGTSAVGTQLGTATNPDAFDANIAIYWTPTVDGVELDSRLINTRYALPVAAGVLDDVSIIVGDTDAIATAGDFTFATTRLYSLTTSPTGATINTSTGAIDVSGVAVVSAASIVVRCADASDVSRFAQSGFSLDVSAATITAAGTDAPSTAGIASIADGTTVTQILTAMTDLGNPSTNGVGTVTTTRSVTVNGITQAGSTTVSEEDAVRVIVTYSATGAPNLAFTLGPVTVTVATGNTTNIIAVPDGFNVLSLADRTPLVITAVPDGFNTVLET